MIQRNVVYDIVQEWVSNKDGFFIVQVEVLPENSILVEIDNIHISITVDDCVELHRLIESKLNRDVDDYDLEVGSAGIGQPFLVKEQYIKNIGNEVEVLAGSTKLTGVLSEVNEEGFSILIPLKKGKKKKEGEATMSVADDNLRTFAFSEPKYVKQKLRFK